MSQRTRINNMNFGGLLQIRTDKLVSREMLKYLYDRLDPDTMVLVLGKDRVIHINPFAVKQAFGIPDSARRIISTHKPGSMQGPVCFQGFYWFTRR